LAVAASRVRADIAFAAVDVFVVIAAYTVGLALRMADPLIGDSADFWSDLALALPFIIVVHLIFNIVSGAYGHVWEHASVNEALRVVAANAATTTALIVANLGVRQVSDFVIPYAVLVVGGLVSLMGMGLVRFRSRVFSFHKATGTTKVLVVGVGREAAAFAREVPELDSGRIVIGFLSTGPSAVDEHRKLAGLEVLGTLSDLPELILTREIDEVVVAGADARLMRRVVDICLNVDVRLRMLPAAEDVIQGRATAVDVRDISVEDILVRESVETDLTAVREILSDKRVMVTGAGGSIGSEIVRQVLQFSTEGVWAFDRDESLLHDARLKWDGSPHLILGDVRRAESLLSLFERVRPDVVFHAAALKHVPMLEDFADEAVLTNVVGTRNVIEAGSRNGMERFVLISTDKAVSPTSVMGATKRVAELLTQVGNQRDDGCIYTSVRFGNVLGSRGSVIPTFVHQIQSGGPVTVTDPAMTRYFMTVDEAVQLVLQASALAQGSELFLLDMGEPIKIVDLARRLIRLAGLAPGRDIEIQYTGRRPGEKLAEMLALDPLTPTSHTKIFEVALDLPAAPALMAEISELEEAAESGEIEVLMNRLRSITNATFDEVGEPEVLDVEGVRRAASWS
jgi:FlaA1/EpsC-like NDP-sugar epimerase